MEFLLVLLFTSVNNFSEHFEALPEQLQAGWVVALRPGARWGFFVRRDPL